MNTYIVRVDFVPEDEQPQDRLGRDWPKVFFEIGPSAKEVAARHVRDPAVSSVQVSVPLVLPSTFVFDTKEL